MGFIGFILGIGVLVIFIGCRFFVNLENVEDVERRSLGLVVFVWILFFFSLEEESFVFWGIGFLLVISEVFFRV